MPCPSCCQRITCCPDNLLESYISILASAAQCESWYILTEQGDSEIINAENTDRLEQELAP